VSIKNSLVPVVPNVLNDLNSMNVLNPIDQRRTRQSILCRRFPLIMKNPGCQVSANGP
jgi:hypothetical protein